MFRLPGAVSMYILTAGAATKNNTAAVASWNDNSEPKKGLKAGFLKHSTKSAIASTSNLGPSGTFWKCNAKAIGSGSEGADSSFQEQYNKTRDSSTSSFWAKTSVDIEPRRIRFQSNIYTTIACRDYKVYLMPFNLRVVACLGDWRRI